MSSDRGMIVIHDDTDSESSMIYYQDVSPEWMIPDIHRAYRSMIAKKANFTGEARDYDLWKSTRASYIASAIISQSPGDYQPAAGLVGDLNWVVIVRPKVGKTVRWAVEIRAGDLGETPDDLSLSDQIDSGDIRNLAKRYPDRGRYTLRDNIVAIEVWDYQYRGCSDAKFSIRSGFLTIESAKECARFRAAHSGQKTEVRTVDRLSGETVVATYFGA